MRSDCCLFSLFSDQNVTSLSFETASRPLSWTSAFINKHACVANKIVSLLIVCKYITLMLIHHDHRTLRIAIRTHVTYAKEAIAFFLRRKLRARVNYLAQESPKCSSNFTKGNPISIYLFIVWATFRKSSMVQWKKEIQMNARWDTYSAKQFLCNVINGTVLFCKNLLRASNPWLKELRQGLRVQKSLA